MDGEISNSTTEEKMSCQRLTPQTTANLLDSVDAFLFDCDGVIWKGDALIDGVSDALDTLRALGKRLVFVTNNSTKSRSQYAKKFHSLGISVSEDEIFSSSFAAAMYLKVNDFPKEKKVYVIGEEGIGEELQLAGFTSLGGPEDGKKAVQLRPNYLFEHDKSVGAVVVGLDHYINYYKLQYATLCIRENPGCLFIATNRDAVGHLTDLQEWPGAGCMVAAVCGSTQKEPIVVGKPSTFLMEFLLKKFNIPTSRMCMVGDRLDTDILFGQNAGCRTLLVLSGVTNISELQDSNNHIRPEYFTDKVSDIISKLKETSLAIQISAEIKSMQHFVKFVFVLTIICLLLTSAVAPPTGGGGGGSSGGGSRGSTGGSSGGGSSGGKGGGNSGGSSGGKGGGGTNNKGGRVGGGGGEDGDGGTSTGGQNGGGSNIVRPLPNGRPLSRSSSPSASLGWDYLIISYLANFALLQLRD
ncbi:Phosphoglycolate phosphatase 2 [Sesamum alatum]|uniref:phosphoglycolate phosphatase n=1 Tax=Sesamum alatum TaxID=300844 RepID=A0AAE1Z170_9LAMI|nr:Phosphoglycolate phosphatase 2 [Sesamum alatum]